MKDIIESLSKEGGFEVLVNVVAVVVGVVVADVGIAVGVVVVVVLVGDRGCLTS